VPKNVAEERRGAAVNQGKAPALGITILCVQSGGTVSTDLQKNAVPLTEWGWHGWKLAKANAACFSLDKRANKW
jgi:hypothetical protein